MEEKIIDKTILLGWIQLSQKLGIDSEMIVSELNIQNDETHVLFSDFALFVDWLVEKTGNTNLGLLLGQQSNIAALGIVGQVIKSSNNVRKGLEQAIRFFNLFSNVLTLRMEEHESSVSLVFDIDSTVFKQYERACQQLLLTSMMFSYNEIYFLTLKEFKPNYINLSFSPSKEIIERSFKCDLELNVSENILQFDKSIIEQPIIYADYELMLVLEKLACKRLVAQNGNLNTFPDIVKAVVFSLIDPSFPDLKTVATHLNMSERSLQRKLSSDKTSYTELVTNIKKDLAEDFLKKDLSVKETSYLLGYSEPSAFIKAFQSWFNITPQSFKLSITENKN